MAEQSSAEVIIPPVADKKIERTPSAAVEMTAKEFVENKVRALYPQIGHDLMPNIDGALSAGYLSQEDREIAIKMMQAELKTTGKPVPEEDEKDKNSHDYGVSTAAKYMALLKDKEETTQKKSEGISITAGQEEETNHTEIGSRLDMEKHIKEAQLAIDALVEFAISNGANPEQLDHLSEVSDLGAYVAVNIRNMPGGVAGLMLTETGDVMIREDRTNNFHDIFHESVHRSAFLGNKAHNSQPVQVVVANIYGFKMAKDGKTLAPENFPKELSKEARDEYLRTSTFVVKMDTSRLKEGLTEWTVQIADGLVMKNGQIITINEEDKKNPDDVTMIKNIKIKLIQVTSMTEIQADSVLITCALSGNVKPLVELIGGNSEMIEAMSFEHLDNEKIIK